MPSIELLEVTERILIHTFNFNCLPLVKECSGFRTSLYTVGPTREEAAGGEVRQCGTVPTVLSFWALVLVGQAGPGPSARLGRST